MLFWIMAIMDGWRGIKRRGLRSWLAARLPSLSTLALTSLRRAAGHYLFAGITALPDAVPQTLATSSAYSASVT
ncbi:hypothetical protein ACULNC_18795 [Shigella flexneri]